ncbi:MAG: bifunctional murein DD-endopeptidase/murein LD-carboxypeptidase [Plesiomonas sp.]|uniref:bifunctional murein DD-endopeptidase/murein LD-carboxypeptidase n=1 Tax=Plesiomonas sp. TaxID=2486279 RepID=UPI003F3BF909
MTEGPSAFNKVLRTLPMATLMLLLSACSTTATKTHTKTHTDKSAETHISQVQQASQAEFEELVSNTTINVKTRILEQFSEWRGVRYRLGGNSKKGIDCSAFVQRTFFEQFGIELPRSTRDQQTTGKLINKKHLQPGDLVLFKTGSTGRHVGIYIGNSKFVHASTSSGVMISNLNDGYWKNRYRQARRVISVNEAT